ncbi:MAG: type IV pilus assembly protein PilM [Acidimicrobiales bacterium]
MAQRIVGLDIGTSAVRAVELTVDNGSRPVLEAFGQVGLPAGAVVDGEIRDRSQVVQALQRVWKEGGFKQRKVVLGLAGLRAITREVDMPPLAPDELDEAVKFQADQVVPFSMDETIISSKVMAQFTDEDGTPQIRVLVAAAHRELVDGVVGAVRAAGLEPVGIDLDTAALGRALYDPASGGAAEAVVSVGAGLTLVVVHQAGQLQFVRTIDLGGESITASLAGALDIPRVDAEQVKRELGQPGPHDFRAEAAVRSAVGDLVGEIHNSIRFYSSQPGRSAPARVLVTGAGARATGFMEQLQGGLDMPVVPASPLAGIDTSQLPITPEQTAAIDATLAVPVGLALPDPKGRSFNLLPDEVTAEFTEKRVRNALVVAGLVVLLLLVIGTMWRVLAVHNAENQVASLTQQVTFINTVEIPKYDKVVSIQKDVQSLAHRDAALVSSEVDWLVVFNQLGQYLPATAVFSTVEMSAATTPTRPSPTSSSSTTSSAAASPIGSGTASVTVPNYTAFSGFGDTMGQSPVITLGPPSGSLANGTSITFHITFSIGKEAAGQRASLFATTTGTAS